MNLETIYRIILETALRHYPTADLIGRDVDLLNLHQVSTVMQHQVVGYGTLLYVGYE